MLEKKLVNPHSSNIYIYMIYECIKYLESRYGCEFTYLFVIVEVFLMTYV